MARDSSGNYTLPGGNPVVSGTAILSDGWANPTLDDLANEITNSLDRLGRGGMLAPFKFVDGTEASPGMAWSSEPGTGFYRAASGDMRATVLSQDKVRFNGTGLSDKRRTGPTTSEFFRVASEKHFYSDDEERGLVVNSISGQTQVLVDDLVTLSSLVSEFRIFGEDAANITFRFRQRSDNANKGSIFWNEANTRLQVSAQNGATGVANFRIQVQKSGGGSQAVFDATAEGSTVVRAGEADRLTLAANGANTMLGSLTTIGNGSFVSVNGSGNTTGVYLAGWNDGGGFGLRTVSSGQIRLEQRSAVGALEQYWLRRIRNGLVEAYHGAQEARPAWQTFARGLTIDIDGTQTPDGGSGAQIIFKGENLGGSSSPDYTFGNSGGDAVVSHAGVEGLRVKANGGGVEHRVADTLTLKDIANGVRVYGAGASARVELYRDGAERGNLLGTALETSLNSVGELRLQRNTNEAVLVTEASGRTLLYGSGAARMRILEATDANSYASVRDLGGTFRAVGYNVLPITTIGSGAGRDLEEGDCGKKVRLNASGESLTVVDGLSADFACLVFNDSTGDCTIAEGLGITIDWFSGAGKVNGDYTIASGEAVLLTRRGTSTTWWVT